MKRKLFGKAASIMLALSVGLSSVQLPASAAVPKENEVIRPTVNYMTDPVGIDAPVSFGWQLSSSEIGQRQTAYDITVENEEGNVVWRSGKTEGSETVGISCPEENLLEGEKYSWRVKVFGSDGKVFGETEGSFEMGVTNDEEWKSAEFICLPASNTAPIFRKVVPMKDRVKSARLYVTAVGVYEAFINGEKVYKIEDGKKVYHHMNPGYGNPQVFLTYETYDVTDLIGENENAVVTFTAGTGWSDVNGNFIMGAVGGQPGVKAMLRVTYEDGETETVITEADGWRGTLEGPITGNGIFFGEDYNAIRGEALGEYWLPDYDDSNWVGAVSLDKNTEFGVIKNEFDPVSTQYMRLSVKAVGPAENGSGESLLQIMELEAYENGENAAKGIVPKTTNSWSPVAQWAKEHLTDGDDGKDSDKGYTTTVLAKGGLSEFNLSEPVTLDLDFGRKVTLNSIKMHCRTKASVRPNVCMNYPKVYDVLVSEDGKSWTKIVDNYDAGDVYSSDPGKLGTLNYKGDIKAASGMSAKIVDEFECSPVSAVLYSGTKAQSGYAGGEIEVDEEYTGENIFHGGITLKAGQTMVVNMGQNMSAIPEIKVSGQRDTLLVMKFAEMLNDGTAAGDRFGNGGHNASGPKGSIYTHSLRTARSEARYVLCGKGIETYQPSMSYFGYQYVQITANRDVVVYSLRSRAVSSVSRQTGKIETNNADVNRLFYNAFFGQLSNYFTIPTDCNQRDERLAWTGDAQAFTNTALYNFDSMAFLNSFQDILSGNTMLRNYPSAVVAPFGGYFDHWATGWSDIEILNLWDLFQKTGDKSLIEKNWEAMNKYYNFIKSNERAPYQAPDPTKFVRTYGDWLAFQGTNHQIVSDCYYGYMSKLMEKMALMTGRDEEAAFYADYFEKQKEAYLSTHVVYNEADEEAIVLAAPKNNEGENSINIPLENVNARFVRLNVSETGPGTSNDNEYRLQIMEEEIYNLEDENIALNKTAGSNNDFNAYGWVIANLTDGKTDSGYSSNNNRTSNISNNPIFITVDLGESAELSKIKLVCRVFENTMTEGQCPNYPKKFTVETSVDGENWITCGKYSVGTENADEPLLTIKSSVYAPGYFDLNKAGTLEDNSQTSLIWMLKLGWYKDETMKQEAIRMLVENIRNENPSPQSIRSKYGKNSLAVGFLGSNVITPVLTDIGMPSLSYDLLLNTELPSWLFEVRAGATTIWERWNSYDTENGFGDAEMNSFNHFAYGSVAEWMYRYMAGIETMEGEGFGKIILQPTPDYGEKYNSEDRIRTVNASYDSIRGVINTNWSADDSGKITSYSVRIPANTTAVLYLPIEGKTGEFKNISGVTYEGMTEHNGISCAKFALKSGGYSFSVGENDITAGIMEGYTAEEIENPEIKKLEILDFDGKKVRLASPEKVTGKIIAAVYGENNELVFVQSIDAEISKGETSFELEKSMEIEGKKLKIMLWDEESLAPLCKTYNIN